MKTIIAIALVCGTVLTAASYGKLAVSPAPISAETVIEDAAPAAVSRDAATADSPQERILRGVIEVLEEDNLVVFTTPTGEQRTFIVNADTNYTLDGLEAQQEDLAVGQFVTVLTLDLDLAVQVDALSVK